MIVYICSGCSRMITPRDLALWLADRYTDPLRSTFASTPEAAVHNERTLRETRYIRTPQAVPTRAEPVELERLP